MLQGCRGVTATRVGLSNALSRARLQEAGRGRYQNRARCKSGAARDRPLRVADPLAPGARVEPRAADSRDFEREQALAGGHARAAHADDAGGARDALAPVGGEPLARQEAAVRAQVALEEAVDRARHVARDRVERLDF